MIADWGVEAAAESPVIALPWPGWVDLRAHPENALAEVQAWPELAGVLRVLNGPGLVTSKVDVFPVTRDDADPELAEAGLAETACGLGSYVDCLRGPAGFAVCEQVARTAVARLRSVPLPCASAEIVIRPARLYDEGAFGWTLYALGFGPGEREARARWAEAALRVAECFEQSAGE